MTYVGAKRGCVSDYLFSCNYPAAFPECQDSYFSSSTKNNFEDDFEGAWTK